MKRKIRHCLARGILKFFLNPVLRVYRDIPICTDEREYEHRKMLWELRNFKAELERDLAS